MPCAKASRSILAGSISPSGSGYRITVKGANPDGSELWTRSASSRTTSDADVLSAVAAVASDIRTALGDTASRQDRQADAESVTTSSLEALQSYTAAQELFATGKFDEAVKEFKRSTAKDQNFGRAYAGLANTLFFMGRKDEAEENWKKALALMDRMTEREKYRTQGTYFFAIARNYEKAIDNYETLIKQYPTDSSGSEQPRHCLFHGPELSRRRRKWASGCCSCIRRTCCSATTSRSTRCTPGISRRPSNTLLVGCVLLAASHRSSRSRGGCPEPSRPPETCCGRIVR